MSWVLDRGGTILYKAMWTSAARIGDFLARQQTQPGGAATFYTEQLEPRAPELQLPRPQARLRCAGSCQERPGVGSSGRRDHALAPERIEHCIPNVTVQHFEVWYIDGAKGCVVIACLVCGLLQPFIRAENRFRFEVAPHFVL